MLATTVTDNMAQKCVHKGCGKVFADADESCVYHPGPPIFHEGQKGRFFTMGSRAVTYFFTLAP